MSDIAIACSSEFRGNFVLIQLFGFAIDKKYSSITQLTRVFFIRPILARCKAYFAVFQSVLIFPH
jgi:hypothetical protein